MSQEIQHVCSTLAGQPLEAPSGMQTAIMLGNLTAMAGLQPPAVSSLGSPVVPTTCLLCLEQHSEGFQWGKGT